MATLNEILEKVTEISEEIQQTLIVTEEIHNSSRQAVSNINNFLSVAPPLLT